MQAAKVDDLAELVRQAHRTLPRIVCICDEYADLVSRGRQERKAVEERILRLGQKARASGIHLILATQQPSREIIKGALDSNMPCRVGLKMQKAIESRMLLETTGAEKLLGNGDLLFRDLGPPRRFRASGSHRNCGWSCSRAEGRLTPPVLGSAHGIWLATPVGKQRNLI